MGAYHCCDRYCWGGGIYWYSQDKNAPGLPSPMYQTVREVNADASAWGGELLAGGFGFATALHTGFSDANGGGAPSAQSVVVAMDDDLLVGAFVPKPKPKPKPKPEPNPHRTGDPERDGGVEHVVDVVEEVKRELDLG